MKKNKWSNIILTVLILFTIGFVYFTWRRYQWYNPPYSSEINTVLFMAGDNRSELEKVLKHYGRNPSDSLKLRAAEFLIVNMPGKGTIAYDLPWEDVSAAFKVMIDVTEKERLLKTFGIGKKIIKEDVKYITGEYLINNIELAFKMWEGRPWKKDISFDIFCEEILPYRYYNEALENWREKILASFADVSRIIGKQNGITIIQACEYVHSKLPRIRSSYDMPCMNYSMMMNSQCGSCEDMAAFEIFVMRALGIPVTCDFTIQWPNRSRGHSWNAVYDGKGNHISFTNEIIPGYPHTGITLPKSKVYRRTFAIQQEKPEVGDAKQLLRLRERSMIDVSKEYERCIDIEIPVSNLPDGVNVVYLASMDGLQQWTPVDYGMVNQNKVRFFGTGKNVLYLPVYYEGETQIPANYPFLLNENGNIIFFEPDINTMHQLTVSSISATRRNKYKRMIAGYFEISDFSGSRKCHVLYSKPHKRYWMESVP